MILKIRDYFNSLHGLLRLYVALLVFVLLPIAVHEAKNTNAHRVPTKEIIRAKNNCKTILVVPFNPLLEFDLIFLKSSTKPIIPNINKDISPIHKKLLCKSDHKIEEIRTLKIIKTPPIVGVPAF